MCVCGALLAQPRLAFEVASVKLNTTNGQWDMVPRRSGDRVTMHNTQLGNMVNYAYHLNQPYELAGSLDLPAGWNWYDVEAKVEGSPTDDEVRLMFQTLLEDRFHLKVHRETREMAVYELVAAKGGPKLTPSVEDSKVAIDGRPLRKGSHGTFLGVDGAHLIGKGVTLAQLASDLARSVRGPVTDRTGIEGTFDYDLLVARENKPENQPEDTNPTPPVAIQALGLRLERSKGSVQVLVVDHVEKPGGN